MSNTRIEVDSLTGRVKQISLSDEELNYSEPFYPPEAGNITAEQKLEALGISIEELKVVLGLSESSSSIESD